jgi:alpha-beta hydrolase superfamily lysophospholipase
LKKDSVTSSPGPGPNANRTVKAALRHAGLFAAYATLGALILAIVGFVVLLDSRPDLRPWHLAELDAEFSVDSDVSSLEEYLELEDRLFRQLEREVYAETGTAERYELNRFKRGSPSDPRRWPRNWNRSFELEHDEPRAAVLLLHGLSDSPYSLRAPGQSLHAAGAHVLGLRIPGHGTAPSGLTDTTWQDMAAAVELAVADLDRRFPELPLYLVGYSNGAALALHHALAAIEQSDRRLPDRLILISPGIAITPAAAMAVWQARLARWLGMDKLAWNDLQLEYDPFKYGSFAVGAGELSHRLTVEIKRHMDRLARSGGLDAMPPVLAFSSLVDATVRAPELVARVLEPLPPADHELVLFDVNRQASMSSLLKWRPDEWIAAMSGNRDIGYRLTLVTNESANRRTVEAREYGAGRMLGTQPLDLAWPPEVYSLSHVALSFPKNDPLYGGTPEPTGPGLHLGTVALRGERGVLQIGDSAMLRQRWNPFYDYLEERMLAFLQLP